MLIDTIGKLYGTVEIKEYRDLPDIKVIPCQNFHTSILQSHYFISSWIKHSELNIKNFDSKLLYLMEKDKLKDPKWIPVTHIICFDTLTKCINLVEIRLFRSILLQYKNESYDILKITFGNHIDFFVPRSIWWKSFITLEGKLNLTNTTDYTNMIFYH